MSNEAPDPNQKPDRPLYANPKEALLARIENDFTYHAPKGDQQERHVLIRETAKKLARVLVENCPQSRELSVALTALEAAVFNANAAISRNE